jgi:diacylglycerol O-acyltransferase-1
MSYFSFSQIPLVYLSGYMHNSLGPRFGNLLVWLSLIIGQPMAVMMYYHDFAVVHYGKELMQTFGKV